MDYPERDYTKYNAYLPVYLNRFSKPTSTSMKMWACPVCGSGTHKNMTGALKLYRDEATNTWSWFCHVCRQGGDIYKLHKLVKHYKVMGQAYDDIEKLANDPSYSPDIDITKIAQAAAPKKQQASDETIASEICRCADAIWNEPDALEYLHQRGLTDDTINAENIGFKLDDYGTRRIVIPYNADHSYYGTRAIEPAKYSHINCDVSPMQIFYPEYLNRDTDVVFVVESPICAISIMQATGYNYFVTAICGNHLDILLEHLKQNPTKAVIALCFDQDEAGTKFTTEAMAGISDLGMRSMDVRKLFFTGANPGDPSFRKDPNEILQHDGEAALKAAVESAAAECRKLIPVEQPKEKESDMPEEIKDQPSQEQAKQPEQRTLESFLDRIRSHKYEPVPTGIKAIDKAIGGGFMRQQLIILGAAPSVGKTALTQWMFEGMAEQHNTPCLFLNLEMSADQLEARSISRIAARHGEHITDMQILKAYEADEPTWAKIQTAAREYYSQIAPRFHMRPATLTSDLDSILEYMESAAKAAHDKGEPVPFVVIDYLQLITSGNQEDSTVIKRAVAAFKNYAIQHDSLVLVIVAHNRQANGTGRLTMESGRDTSAIEYSADVQMGLTYTKCLTPISKDKKGNDIYPTPAQLTREDKQYLTIQILKGRFGGAGADIKLYFDGETMTFLQVGEDFTPYNGKIPKELDTNISPIMAKALEGRKKGS